jgi:iron complex transport system ATP-binding protein
LSVRELFGLVSEVIPDPVSGTPMVVPIGRHWVAPRIFPALKRTHA